MQKIKYLILFYTVFATFLNASDRPKWITETPAGFVHDFYVGTGTSRISESNARDIALANALQKIVQSGVIMLQGTQEIKTQSVEKFKDGQSISFDAIDNVVNDIRVVGESKTVKGLREEEYYVEENSGVFTVWSLVKMPKQNPKPYEEPSKVTSVLRSLIPGVEQFHKEEHTKGILFVGGTASFLISGFVFSNLKITAESDARNSRTQTLRDYYNENSNTYNNISLACFITTAAIYVYNVVDALATDGNKVYVFEHQNRNIKDVVIQNQFVSSRNLLSVKIEF